jgi:hypothetical protein
MFSAEHTTRVRRHKQTLVEILGRDGAVVMDSQTKKGQTAVLKSSNN